MQPVCMPFNLQPFNPTNAGGFPNGGNSSLLFPTIGIEIHGVGVPTGNINYHPSDPVSDDYPTGGVTVPGPPCIITDPRQFLPPGFSDFSSAWLIGWKVNGATDCPYKMEVSSSESGAGYHEVGDWFLMNPDGEALVSVWGYTTNMPKVLFMRLKSVGY